MWWFVTIISSGIFFCCLIIYLFFLFLWCKVFCFVFQTFINVQNLYLSIFIYYSFNFLIVVTINPHIYPIKKIFFQRRRAFQQQCCHSCLVLLAAFFRLFRTQNNVFGRQFLWEWISRKSERMKKWTILIYIMIMNVLKGVTWGQWT